MFYCYIVKKNEKEKGKSPVSKLLDVYTRLYGQSDFIVCLPGFLSKNKSAMDTFINEFTFSKNPEIFQRGYFFIGYNGCSLLKGTSFSKQDYINSKFGNYNTSLKQRKDHSKVVVFFEKNSFLLNEEDKNIDSLIKYGKVNAILIGSSNQSYTTYFKSPADKGETDVLLVDGDIIKDDVEALHLIANFSFLNSQIFILKEIKPQISLRTLTDEIFGLTKINN